MSEKLPFMPWYGFDYEADERCKLLSDAEDGIYRKLLWEQWKEGSVPADPVLAARLIRSDNPDLVPHVLSQFFRPNGTDGRLYNPRLHVIRRQIEAERSSKSRGGKRGRRKQLESEPGLSPGDTPGSARAQPGQPEPESEPEGKQQNPQTPTAPPEAQPADPVFQTFWQAYRRSCPCGLEGCSNPKRSPGDKAKTQTAWQARLREGVSAEALIGGAERAVKYAWWRVWNDDRVSHEAFAYLPAAERFLSPTKRRWEEAWRIPSTWSDPDAQSTLL